VTFDTALNLLWCAIGAIALFALGLSERLKVSGNATGRMRRVLAVLLTTVSLFPCVSATDDEFCLSLLQSTQEKRGGVGAPVPEDGKEKVGQCLARLLEALDHFQVSSAYDFAIILCFIGLVLLAIKLTSARALLCRAGRAPPSPCCA
jgi:hypothetical protein